MAEDSKIPAPLMEKPHHLFRPEKDYSKMTVVPETVELLKQIKTPVVIVTIVGTQRGGKSTLLNLLHSRKTAGFGLGHFMDACTTGLWIWCRPHPRDPDLTVILMDTEGLDSPHVPQWYNWTLSALALLISTYFIYQTKGSIDSNATDRLGVILKVAEQLRGGIDDKTDKPEFLWLIRDHQLAMKKAPKTEMSEKLDGGSLKALQRCFNDYDCVPLPRPVDRDELLKDVEKLAWDELRSEFREEYVVLERSIYNIINRPRNLSGRPVTGDVIASLVTKYAASITGKDGILTSLSQLPTQRQMVVKLAGERAVSAAVQEYTNKINQLLDNKYPVSDTALAEAHQQAYDAAIKLFQNEANIEDMKNLDADLEEYLAQFNKQINNWQLISTVLDGECVMVQKLVGGQYYQVWKKNIDVSKKRCHDELTALYTPLADKVKQADFASIQDFYKEVEDIKSKYRASDNATGSAKQLVEVQFYESKISSDAEVVSEAIMRKEFTAKDQQLHSELLKYIQDALKQQEETFKQQLQSQATQYEAKVEALTNALKQATEESKNTTEKLADKINQLQVPVALHTQQLQTVSTSVESIQTELKALALLQTRVETIDVKFNAKNEQYEKNISDLEKKVDSKSEDLKQTIQQHQASSSAEIANLNQSFKQQSEHMVSTTTTKIEEAVSGVRVELSNGLKLSEEKTSQLVSELKAALETRSDNLKQDTESKVNSIAAELASWKQTAQQQTDSLLQQITDITVHVKQDLTKQYDEKFSTLLQQIQSVESSTSQASAFQQTMEERATLLENVASELKLHQQSLSTSTGSTQEQLKSDIQKLSSTVQQLHSQLESLSQVNNALKSLESDLQKKISSVVQAQEQFGTNYKDKMDEGIRSLTTRCSANEQLIDAFRKNMEQLQTSLVSSKQLADAVSQVDQKLGGIQSEIKKMKELSTAASEASKSVDHLKHSLDAIWESIGVLSGRIVNVEALVDKHN